jgi:hypothetical protein
LTQSFLILLPFVKHRQPVLRTSISIVSVTKHVTEMRKVSGRVDNAHLIVQYTEALRKTDLRCTFRAHEDTLSTVFFVTRTYPELEKDGEDQLDRSCEK